jgi:transcriptional regulator with XRE-family HTH domain
MSGKKKRDFYNPSIENKALGMALRGYRTDRKLSQEEFGHESGIDRTYVSLVERGQRSPTFSTIMLICNALNISLVDFATKIQENLHVLGSSFEQSIAENSTKEIS